MSNQLNMFRYVVGAAQPLRLLVSRDGDRSPKTVEIDAPYAIIGRASACHVSLPDEKVAFRQAYLQVIGGRVACIDLYRPAGMKWDGPRSGVWLSPEHRIRMGRHWIQLFDDGWLFDADLASPLEFKPRAQTAPEYGTLPVVELCLAGGPNEGASWPINRIITLVGRDDSCRITCSDENISRIHCGLLLAPSGLWAVDLVGRGGIRINGEQAACGFLHEDAELQVGRYTLKARYPQLRHWQAQQAALSDRPSPAFLTRQHAVFPIEEAGDTLIVRPQGDIRQFFYQDIQLESNRIKHLLQTYPFQFVLIDFRDIQEVGAIVTEAIAGFCRTAAAGAALCQSPPQYLDTLRSTSLFEVWPYYDTRVEALQAMHSSMPPTVGS